MAPPAASNGRRSRPPTSMGASTRTTSSPLPTSSYARTRPLDVAGPSGSRTPQTSDLSTMVLCYNCGGEGHFAKYCKVLKKCHKCGQPGHLMRGCNGQLNGNTKRNERVGPEAAQSRRPHRNEAPRKHAPQPLNTFERENGFYVKPLNKAEVEEPGGKAREEASTPNLIDLSSVASENTSVDYDPAKFLADFAPPPVNKQLYSLVTQGYSADLPKELPVELAEPSLIDQIDEQPVEEEDPDKRISVALVKKRKGRKGRSTTYDLTPFLSY